MLNQNEVTMFTQTQIGIIISAQEAQLANPTRAMVNTESAFVSDRITKVDRALGTVYWNWVCCFNERNSEKFGTVVKENEFKLALNDSRSEMHKWGYSGT